MKLSPFLRFGIVASLMLLTHNCVAQVQVLVNPQVLSVSELDERKGTYILDMNLNLYAQLRYTELGNSTELVFDPLAPTTAVQFTPADAVATRFSVEFHNSVGRKLAVHGPIYKASKALESTLVARYPGYSMDPTRPWLRIQARYSVTIRTEFDTPSFPFEEHLLTVGVYFPYATRDQLLFRPHISNSSVLGPRAIVPPGFNWFMAGQGESPTFETIGAPSSSMYTANILLTRKPQMLHVIVMAGSAVVVVGIALSMWLFPGETTTFQKAVGSLFEVPLLLYSGFSNPTLETRMSMFVMTALIHKLSIVLVYMVADTMKSWVSATANGTEASSRTDCCGERLFVRFFGNYVDVIIFCLFLTSYIVYSIVSMAIDPNCWVLLSEAVVPGFAVLVLAFSRCVNPGTNPKNSPAQSGGVEPIANPNHSS
jgi:hypothetical protein